MNLRDLAAAHHRAIVGDSANGFGREITLVSPEGLQAKVTGLWNDIGQNLDLQTGSMVSGRMATIRVTRGALRAAGLSLPYGVLDKDKAPWRALYTDLGGRTWTWKVSESRADRTFDAVDLYLESFQQQ